MTEDKKVIIGLDAMGGDYAPEEQVKGAVQAVQADPGIIVRLFGDESRVRDVLNRQAQGLGESDRARLEVVHCESVIENCDIPTVAIRKKKDSSMVKGLYALRDGEADAFLSCGSTGALLVGGQTIVGRIKGVSRASLAFLLPSIKGPVLLLDAGANVDTRPDMLLQFARMGAIYMEHVVGVKDPRVGLVNIGEEESKGNQLVKETFPLLKECPDIHFSGSVESRGLAEGLVDVAVCDGFVGNVILKSFEGVAGAMLHVIRGALTSSARSKMGALLVKKDLKNEMRKFSLEEYGGAPMLGLKQFVTKTHGNSMAPEIRNTILQCKTAVTEQIARRIAESFDADNAG